MATKAATPKKGRPNVDVTLRLYRALEARVATLESYFGWRSRYATDKPSKRKSV